MAKFEIWLDMNLKLVDGGAAVSKITLEGPDGTTWGTWTRDFPELVQSITAMLGALREELPKGRHCAKLFAWAADGTQLSVFPLTMTGASEAATEGAQTQLIQQRANALLLSNVEKSQAGMITLLEHTAHIAQQITEANRNLTADAQRSAIERDEGRLRVLREEGKQRRLDEMTQRIMPLVELALGVLAERAADWVAESQKKPQIGPVGKEPTALGPEAPPPAQTSEVHSPNASGEQGTPATSSESHLASDSGSDPQPEELAPDGQGCPIGSSRDLAERNGSARPPPGGGSKGRKSR